MKIFEWARLWLWPAYAEQLVEEREAALARVRELEEELAARDTCVVCGCLLMAPDAPPHCEDCTPTEENCDDWEDRHK